jgi:hypothetical protein
MREYTDTGEFHTLARIVPSAEWWVDTHEAMMRAVNMPFIMAAHIGQICQTFADMETESPPVAVTALREKILVDPALMVPCSNGRHTRYLAHAWLNTGVWTAKQTTRGAA